MLKFIIRRIISSIIAFFIFTALLFFSFDLLLPFDYVDTLSLQIMGNEARAELRRELEIDAPVWEQYIHWLERLAYGDLGTQFSFRGPGVPVADLIKSVVPSTLLVFMTGGVVAFWLGQWLGRVTAWQAPKWLAGLLSIGSIATYTAFPPWLAFLMGYFLVLQFDFLPFRAPETGFHSQLWQNAPIAPDTVMVRMVVSFLIMLALVLLLRRFWQRWRVHRLPNWIGFLIFVMGVYLIWLAGDYAPYALDVASAAAVPFITFLLLGFGDTMLIMQTGMMDTRNEMYVQTARAKGLPPAVVRDRHVARTALLPVLSRFVINLPYLLTSIVIVEFATSWPGVGTLLFASVADQQTNVYMGILVIVALISLVARIVLDVVYAYTDPRIRFGAQLAGGVS